MRTAANRLQGASVGNPLMRTLLAAREHAPEVRICPSCRGRKVDRHGFDCLTCLGEGTVDE